MCMCQWVINNSLNFITEHEMPGHSLGFIKEEDITGKGFSRNNFFLLLS